MELAELYRLDLESVLNLEFPLPAEMERNEWDGLSDREKALIVVYVDARKRGIVGLDAREEAILAAFDTKDVRTARRMTYEMFARLSVLRVLSLMFGASDPEVKELTAHARSKKRITHEEFRELRRIKAVAQLGDNL
jgi:hypothetical protein